MATLFCSQCGRETDADVLSVTPCSCGGKAFVSEKPTMFAKSDPISVGVDSPGIVKSGPDVPGAKVMDYRKAAFQSE